MNDMSRLFYMKESSFDVKRTRLLVVSALQENLSNYVRKIIHDKGLNYREVSRRTGGAISHATVGDIVNGVSKDVRTDTLRALAKGLGVSEDEIFAIARGKSLQPMTPTDFGSALEALGIEHFQQHGGIEKLTDEDRAELAGTIGAMIEQRLIRISKTKPPDHGNKGNGGGKGKGKK